MASDPSFAQVPSESLNKYLKDEQILSKSSLKRFFQLMKCERNIYLTP